MNGESENRPEMAPAADRLRACLGAFLAEYRPSGPASGPAMAVSLDDKLERDLGIDSLGRVELFARLEREFDRALPERVLAEAETPRDVLRALLAAPAPLREKPVQEGLAPLPATALAPPGAATPLPGPETETLLASLLHHAKAAPERPHLRLLGPDGEALTYGALAAEAAAVARGLRAQGIGVGEAVLLMLPTGADYFRAFLGVWLAGAVPAPIYPPARLSHLGEHLIRHAGIAANCGARLLVTWPQAMAAARLLRLSVPGLDQVVDVAGLAALGQDVSQPLPVAAPQDLALLQYTSGSTGDPKGVALSHRNLLANIRAMGAVIGPTSADVFVSWLPLYHDMGLIGAWLGSLHYGLPLMLMSPLSFLARPERWLRAISDHRGTLSAAPNFAFDLCLRRIGDEALAGLDLSSWRGCFNGAEAIVPDTLTRFIDRFAPCGFSSSAMRPVYGLAECSVGLAFTPAGRGPRIETLDREAFTRRGEAVPGPESEGALRFVSCGLPLPGHEVRAVDDQGRECPERHGGRLQFRGPSATSGYWRNAEANRRLFQDGWLETGDLGYIAAGEVVVTGRVKDLIIRAGRNLAPAEIEAAAGEVPGVRKDRVAAFGTLAAPGGAAGTEQLVVLAETRESDPGQREDLRRAVAARIDSLTGEVPDLIVLVPPNTVLRTSSGKIRRAACKQLFEEGRLEPRPAGFWQWLAAQDFLPGWALPRGWTFLSGARLTLGAARPILARAGRRLAAWGAAGRSWALVGLFAPLLAAWTLVAPGAGPRWRGLAWLLRLLARLCGVALRLDGGGNLPESGAFVLAANHASYLDAFIVAALLGRPLVFVAKAELGGNPLLHLLLQRLSVLFVERFDIRQGLSDAARAARCAEAGKVLVFFAEGTFTRAPGLAPFHMGAFWVAARVGLPVVPLALRGSRSILRSGSWFPRPGRVLATLGPALAPESGPVWETALDLRARARAFILCHCGEPDLAGAGGEG